MELRHLRYFQAIAELLNFSRAAERLHVAQPALSRQIRDLEAELGVQLFDRNRVRVQLTDAGRTFYAHTCKVLAQIDVAVASVHDTTSGDGGELILCNDWRLSTDLIPTTIAEFRAQHPRVEVQLVDLPVHQQLAALRAHRAHLGFLPREEIVTRGDLDCLHVSSFEVLLVVSAEHRLASRAQVAIAELRDERWIRMNSRPNDGYNTFVAQICRLAGFTPDFHGEAATSQAFEAMIASGGGIGILPDTMAAPQKPLLRFLRTDCASVEVCAVWSKTETSLLLRQYLAGLRQHAADVPATQSA